MNARRVESFLLRLVVQNNATVDPGQWRGRIQHVATGNEQQVEELQDIITFITTHVSGIEDPAPVPDAAYCETSSVPRSAS